MTRTMFEKTALTILIQCKGGLKEVPVYEMEGGLFFLSSGYYLRIKQQGMTSNQNINWVRFSNGMVPTYNTIGFAQAGGRWKAEPKRLKMG